MQRLKLYLSVKLNEFKGKNLYYINYLNMLKIYIINRKNKKQLLDTAWPLIEVTSHVCKFIGHPKIKTFLNFFSKLRFFISERSVISPSIEMALAPISVYYICGVKRIV